MTVTKESVQDQQGSESAYSDPKTKPKYVEKYTKYKGPRQQSAVSGAQSLESRLWSES